ncbi:MAG: hypothetical protein V4647_14680, partial [Pseudomonadota bacterium]
MNVVEVKHAGAKAKAASAALAAASANFGLLSEAVQRRVNLFGAQPPEHASRPKQQLFLAESLSVLEPALRRMRPPLHLPKATHPRVVILMPGFGTHPVRMRYMAQRLEEAGHVVKRWGTGFNFGA